MTSRCRIEYGKNSGAIANKSNLLYRFGRRTPPRQIEMNENRWIELQGLCNLGARIARRLAPVKDPRSFCPQTAFHHPVAIWQSSRFSRTKHHTLRSGLNSTASSAWSTFTSTTTAAQTVPRSPSRRSSNRVLSTVTPWILPHTANVKAQTLAYAHAIMNFGANWAMDGICRS